MLFNEQFVRTEVEYRRNRMLELAGRHPYTRYGRPVRPVAGRVRRWWAEHAYAVR